MSWEVLEIICFVVSLMVVVVSILLGRNVMRGVMSSWMGLLILIIFVRRNIVVV